jgi:hypothetical protein
MGSIAPDDALILPYRANPRRMEFSGTTGEAAAQSRRLSLGLDAGALDHDASGTQPRRFI